MTKMVSLTIDGVAVEAPEGTLVVDAAKNIGIDIPVFCYHPKMEPVGMCRMCLVDIGRPVIDRASGQPVLNEDGSPKIQFGPKLETACTTPVSPGMVVVHTSEKVARGRKDILEFLLTSHPLDCPICDKGGECPLQNLTMAHGPGRTRFLLDEKKHLAKRVPLGELIFLDRERCIQCARCVRFQDDIADDHVLGFNNRGRAWEIISYSDPGFDSYWSGNTTDICPVGALTTADFRFRARPWELHTAASICTQCPVGCNLSMDVRREAVSGGNWVVKRVMPRQNEEVNEIWICDKGRFGYHYTDHTPRRLRKPLVRKNGELQPVEWEEALALVGERFKAAGGNLFTLAGGRLANEDLFNLGKLTHSLGGRKALYSHMGGGELTTRLGLPPGSNFGDLGPGSAVLVVGCDLEEEAPVWWLRISQAAKRGATLIVLNARATKLDRAATYRLRYPFGSAAAAVRNLGAPGASAADQPDIQWPTVAQVFANAKDALVIYGSDGLGLPETEALAQACAALLVNTGHFGRPNNGLVAAWPRANDQGAVELGWRPSANLPADFAAAQALYIVAADPVADNPAFQDSFGGDRFVVVQDLYLSDTARLADVVLPAQAFTEREGTFTNNTRRAQRFYPAAQVKDTTIAVDIAPSSRQSAVLTRLPLIQKDALPDYTITALVADWSGVSGLEAGAASLVFSRLADETPAFKGLNYRKLAETHPQTPIIGRADMYYGGTGYANYQGLGCQLAAPEGVPQAAYPPAGDFKLPHLGAVAFPITRLYDLGATLTPSEVLHERIGEPFVLIGPDDAARLKVSEGGLVRLVLSETGLSQVVRARVDPELPVRVVLAPRSFGLPVFGLTPIELKPAN